jgi:hypothetical protein
MEMTRILKRRAEIDLQSAETLAGHGQSDNAYLMPPPLPAPMRDPATAFARMSRAVRLTVAVEAKTAELLRALRADLPLQPEKRRAEAAERVKAANAMRQDEVSGALAESPAEEIDEGDEDGDEFTAADAARAERLSDHEADEDLAGRPLREVVKCLRAKLDLARDWSGRAGEGTAKPSQAPIALIWPRRNPLSWTRPAPLPLKTPPPTPPPPSAAPPTRGRTAPGSHC